MDPNAFPLIELSGEPHARGLAYGKAARERVHRSLALYRGELERRGVQMGEIHKLARDFTPHVSSYDAAYLEEMRGIAEGAGVALEDVVFINCRTEMMFGARTMIEQGKHDGCTAVIVLPQASADGALIHAHNWDWRQECVDTGVVLKIRRSQGPDMLVFVEAGGLARHGLNAAGVSVTGNFLSCDRDFRTGGKVPLALLRRKFLEAGNLADAMRSAWGSHLACSTNVMLAHAPASGEGEAVNLEMAPDEIFWITPEDGLLVHANHWINPVAQAKLRDTGIAVTVDTVYRQRRVESRVRGAKGKLSVQDLKDALGDKYGWPDSVLRPPKPAPFGATSATVCTTILRPHAGHMSIARKPWEERIFQDYTLA
ncbi:MAG TPA: C45 family peptidase [Burkholderiales bacterium]|jgi:isopenicillin-N N-acyltransferase-like protein|nr:C45 family peptidase [Burkholderiales bacterium]